MPDKTNPWAIDFNQFKAATDPYLKDENFWSDENGSISSGPQLQLANGKTWRPSGWQSGIRYHPKGEVTYETSFDGQGGEGGNQVSTPKTNEEEYWEINGDLSAMTGAPGSEKHVGIKYKKEGDKLVPIEDPNFRDYTTKYGTINRGLLAVIGGGLAANAGLFGNLGSTAGTQVFAPGAEAFKTFEFSKMAATNAAFDASVASGSVALSGVVPEIATETIANTATTAAETATTAAETATNAAETVNTAQEAFRAEELANAAAGVGSAAGGALTSTTEGLSNIISNGIRSAESFVTEVLGIKDAGLAGTIKSVLGVGAAGSTLFDYLMKGFNNAANNNAAMDRVKAQNQGLLDLANLKDQQTQEANKRYSASVSGLSVPGLINQGPLRRTDGTQVFRGNGLINRG